MMNRKGQVSIGLIVLLVIGVIVALTLIDEIASNQSIATQKQTKLNQSVATTTAYLGANEVNTSKVFSIYTQDTWKQNECPLTSVAIRNGAGTALAKDTDYTLTATTGVFSLKNTSKTVPATALNLTYVDYSFCADGYNVDGGARGIAGTWVLFAALAVLAFVTIGVKSWVQK